MLTARALLSVQPSVDGGTSTPPLAMTSRIPVTPAVIGAFTCAVPSTTVSSEVCPSAVSSEAVSGELKPLSAPHGEYLVTRIINGTPVLPLDHLVGRTPSGHNDLLEAGGRVAPTQPGPGDASPSTVIGGTSKDGEMTAVSQRRDLVVLVAAGPQPGTPSCPGPVSHPTATSYFYYTALPRFCTVTTSSTCPSNAMPASGLAGSAATIGVHSSASVVGSVTSSTSNGPAIALPQTSADWTGGQLVGPLPAWAQRTVVSSVTAHAAAVNSDSPEALLARQDSATSLHLVDSHAIKVEAQSPSAEENVVETEVDSSIPTTTTSGGKTFTCDKCFREFASEKYLNMHMSLHLQSAAALAYGVPPEDSSAPSNSLSSSCMVGATPLTLGMGAAAQPTTTSMILTSQQQLMMAPPPIRRTKTIALGAGGGTTSQWTCQICEKTFAQNSNYKNHIRTHSNERPFVCEICAIGFKERYHLKKHVLFKHTDELREECRVCGKRFKDSTAVRAHERTHSDARPYACTRCEKTFKTSECLWHHENRSKTCGKSLGDLLLTAAQRSGCLTSRPRRGRQARRSGRSPPQPPVRPAATPQLPVTIFTTHDSKLDVNAVIANELRARQLPQAHHHFHHHHHQQQQHHHHSIYTNSISPSSAAAQFAELAPTGSHHTASPDQPESGFVSFDIANSIEWKSEISSHPDSAPSDPSHPVVKVETAEMMELLDYSLAAFSTDSLGSYSDVFDKMKVDIDTDETYDDDDDDDEDDEEETDDVCQSQQQLLARHNINGHLMPQSAITCAERAYYPADDMEHQAAFSRCPTTPLAPSIDGLDDEFEQRPYRCDLCRVGFKLKVHLKKHNLYKHSTEYPCECGVCGKKFKDSSAVRLHERIHSTVRPYSCQRCSKTFKTRENLWGHRHRGPCDRHDLGPLGPVLDCGSSLMAGHRLDMAQKRQCQDVEAQNLVGQVVYSPHEATDWTPLPASILDESRSASTAVVPPYRGRAPTTSSVSIPYFGGLVPTAVVAPIKRELPDHSAAGAGDGTTSGGAEKYCLPPFETLVTSHRSPEMSSATSPAATTASSDKHLLAVSTIGLPPVTVDHRLPGIHQLFQTATTTVPSQTGSGNSVAVAVDGENELAWWHQQVPGSGALQLQQQLQSVEFLTKSDTESGFIDGLPPPPPYPGFPQPGKFLLAGSYLGGNGSAATGYNFQSIVSSVRR